MTNIARRPDGRWRARYRDEAGKEHARHFARKVDAQRWLDEVTASVVTGQYVDPAAGRVTFGAFYRDWSSRQIWAPNTTLVMDLTVRSATFADLPLGRIRRSHVEQWVKAMHAAGLAPGTVRTRVNNARTVFKAAVRDRLIAADPSADVVLPRDRRRDAAMSIPTPGQVGQVLETVEGRYRGLVAVAAFAGLRLGEAAGLQVADVDFLRRQVAVSRQVQRAGRGAVEVRAPKQGSERRVPMADELAELLAEHVRVFRPGDDPGRWLFEAGPGLPPNQNVVGKAWRAACAAAGVTGFVFHDLRHFYASGLIADGCDVVTVQRALGHLSASTTMSTYMHLWPDAEDRTRAAAAGLIAAALRPGPAASRAAPLA